MCETKFILKEVRSMFIIQYVMLLTLLLLLVGKRCKLNLVKILAEKKKQEQLFSFTFILLIF